MKYKKYKSPEFSSYISNSAIHNKRVAEFLFDIFLCLSTSLFSQAGQATHQLAVLHIEISMTPFSSEILNKESKMDKPNVYLNTRLYSLFRAIEHCRNSLNIMFHLRLSQLVTFPLYRQYLL